MTLADLRRHLLLVLAPACWHDAPPAKPAPAVVAPKPTKPKFPRFDPKTCVQDTVVETACGIVDENECTADSSSLHVFDDNSWLWISQVRGASFLLNDQRTDEFIASFDGLPPDRRPNPELTACCYSQCTPIEVVASFPVKPQPGWRHDSFCVPMPPGGTSSPAANEPRCPSGVKLWEKMSFETVDGEKCCYGYARRPYNPGGRPMRVEHEPRFAVLVDGTAWHASPPPVESDAVAVAPDAERAAHWLELARMEHASVAAFAATALRLLALGAPPELVADTHRAALDEISHARIAFALAAAYGGPAQTPSTFDIELAPMTLRELAIETFLDGCIGESRGAFEMSREPEPIAQQIATDELRHAQLAWRIVSWCVRCDPSIAALLVAPDDDLGREVIAPCIAALAA